MLVYVLVLAFLWEGEIQMAVYNAGNPNKAHEFKTQAACERERDSQIANIDKVLHKDAKLVQLACVSRNAEGGA